ncbi:helix-turn-helix transcriptional regulator [Rhizobium populisoli]|uniref:helix-turn-helix transcriptional regulator n=1 Tax=Rhizobium populisoli TaxID=2859785 RepID=UPI0035E44B33
MDENPLGHFLKDRRTRLDPVALGFPTARRRTPGLRREEVAQRANVSATWYTWLEQGRGGAPSADVLDRIARALMLTDVEREHLFLLGLGRPPEVRYQAQEGVSPRLQRVLDAMEYTPAYLKNATWDIVAWNRAASAVLADYETLGAEERNILRRIFASDVRRDRLPNWDKDAAFIVAAFRADVTRTGASKSVEALVDELCRKSPDFERMWSNNDVRHAYGETAKLLHHPGAGAIELEYSAFAVEGRPDLGLVVYNPATDGDRQKVRQLVDAHVAQMDKREAAA